MQLRAVFVRVVGGTVLALLALLLIMDSLFRMPNLNLHQLTYEQKQPVNKDELRCLSLLPQSACLSTGQGIDLFALPTPSGFIEIQKTVTKKVPTKNGQQQRPMLINLLSRNGTRSPAMLKKRAASLPKDSPVVKFLEEQQKRRLRTKEICYPKNGTRIVRMTKAYPSVVIDSENVLTFCPIYKSASTSWLTNLLFLKGYTRKVSVNQLSKVVTQEFVRISNIIAPPISRRTTSFIVVRHPMERLISCYRDKFENASKPYYYFRYGENMMVTYRTVRKLFSSEQKNEWLQEIRKNVKKFNMAITLPGNPYASPIGPTFREFAEYITGPHASDEHWRSYYEQCSICSMNYEFVLRFENLARDSELFIEYLNRTAEIGSRWDNPTTDGITTKRIVCKYLSQINRDLYKKIIEKYIIDYRIFDYDPTKYFHCVNKRVEPH